MSKTTGTFDPKVYIIDGENEEFADYGFKKQIFLHRYGLFELFKKLNPTYDASDEHYLFVEFINKSVISMNHTYTIIGYIIHFYFVYWSWSRILYCPVINKWTIQCEYRPWTLVDASGYIQALYYTLSFISQPNFQQIIHYHGTLIMNGTLFLTWCLVDWNYSWILSGSKTYSTWNAVYIPIVYYMFFIYNLSRIGMASWIQSNHRNTELKSTIHKIVQKTWRATYLLLHATVLLLFWSVKIHYPGMDDFADPSYIFLGFLIFIISSVSFVMISFLTYQYDLVVWDQYWTRGLAIMCFADEVTVGMIY